MIYNYVNGKIIIAKMYDEFNIKSRDWENRSPKWIADAMNHLNIFVGWEEVADTIPIKDFRFELPKNLKVLRGILINGKKANRVTSIAHITNNKSLEGRTLHTFDYSISGNTVNVEIKEGIATVIYRTMPLDWDDVLGMFIPKIPDLPLVIDNIGWYILKIILARGYNHPVYSLSTNNLSVNPDYLWRTSLHKAKLSAKRMDNEDRRILSETITRFLTNPNSDSDELMLKDKKIVVPVNNFINYWDKLSGIIFSNSTLQSMKDKAPVITYGEKFTGVSPGILNEIAVSDDFLYVCVVGGDAGTAVWKRIPLKLI